ncbi:MAG: cyclic pyranopterin monophosphate synthase MoaC [Nitrosomonadales bacterium]|nr:cyclic pyranopterin monophosphate synthase MoaC [Nitrosomonadales bacterium]
MLTHIDENGNARMVDISKKNKTSRIAEAQGTILTSKKIIQSVMEDSNKKGDVLTVAKIAGIQAAKKTSGLIPLCHDISLDSISIDFKICEKNYEIQCVAVAKCSGSTGVEMEAMAAVSISLLTIYDMCKGIDKGMIIRNVGLSKKAGGASGTWGK